MDVLCPLCRAPLEPGDEGFVICRRHGGERRFVVLFTREPVEWAGDDETGDPVASAVPAAPAPAASDALSPDPAMIGVEPAAVPADLKCARHPKNQAKAACASCGAGMCYGCVPRAAADGRILCSTCSSREKRRRSMEGLMCAKHPEVPAERKCRICGKPMCATCDFKLPDGFHACPTCVMTPQRNLSSKRRGMAIASLALAGLATFSIIIAILSVAVSGDGDDEDAGFMMLGILGAFVLSFIGMILGFSSLEKRRHNPGIIWIAAIWNSVIIACYILVYILGIVAAGAG